MSIKPPFWHPSVASGFLLDWDGVIAETKLDFSAVRERYYGGRRAMLLEEADALTPEDRKALMTDLCSLEMAGAEKAVPVPGAIELIEWLETKKIPYCIVSRNCSESIELAAKNIGVKLPEHTWSRDNSEWVKPDPRMLVEAADSIGVAPRNCVFIGDFIYDLQGARRSGIRAVLVEREEPEWNLWSDVSYPRMVDLVESLKDPQPIAPWEYREIFAKRGEKWLNGAHELILELPESTSPTLDCWLARAAALAVGTVSISKDSVLGPSEWKNNPSLNPSMMGQSIVSVAKKYLAPRFPMLRITTEEEGLKAPKNSLDLMRFIERKIF